MSEQGHTKNLENFKKEYHFAVSWGTKYAPTNSLLILRTMLAQIAAGEAAMDAIITARTPYRNNVAAAQDAFLPLNELTTRIINAMKGAGIAASVIEDAKTYTRKIKGQRKTPKPKDDPNSPDFDESEKAHSAAQLSRTNRLENLEALLDLLGSQSLYNPNEDEINMTDLTAYLADLKAKTEAVQTSFVNLSNKYADRNAIFYDEETGIVAVGTLFKRYVESFGRNSAEWNQVKGLRFKKIGRD
ncbi:MAG TPA: hypothetical protein PKY59_15310 [Pyrinomonadaceae bacterium]|nr:hypothetical protein [Pyrinomonadaceae bacterium]